MSDTRGSRKGGTSKMGLMIGLGLGAVLGGAGFYAVWSGMVLPPASAAAPVEAEKATPLVRQQGGGETTFVPLDPIIISLPEGLGASLLRFRAELEVPSAQAAEVERLKPRVMDALNAYLRAVDPAELSEVGALVGLREQMRRRVSLVVGGDMVADLLVMEFILN